MYQTSAPKTSTPRPKMPPSEPNPHLKASDPSKIPGVKFQIITREEKEIVVGRVKVPTPGGGHAFILRRFDTGAVSLTTMFRAAFPSATDDQERTESSWIKANYDNAGANGDSATSKLKLAGTWINPTTALMLAEDYGLKHVLPPLVNAKPDLNATYRKSTKGSPGTPAAPTTARTEPPASPSAPNKRRKESSPTPSNTSATRSSARLKSPASKASSRNTTPRSTRSVRQSTARSTVTASTLVFSDQDEDEPHIGADGDAEIAESKKLVEDLKAKRQQETVNGVQSSQTGAKRRYESPTAKLEVAEPASQEVVPRVIATNRRIHLNESQKAAAWGTLAFAFGLGVTAYLLPMLS